jgi:hypothetical protein
VWEKSTLNIQHSTLFFSPTDFTDNTDFLDLCGMGRSGSFYCQNKLGTYRVIKSIQHPLPASFRQQEGGTLMVLIQSKK